MRRAHLRSALAIELANYRDARGAGDVASQWTALERAHVLSQPLALRHLQVHALMLALAVQLRDVSEIFGQLARLVLAPLGNLTGRIPVGNTGRSGVSAFEPMPVPDDLKNLVR